MKKITIIITLILVLTGALSLAKTECSTQELDLPSSFSWGNINGTDFLPPIKNQAPAPTCEAYALVAAVETLAQYEVGYPFDIDLSEAHLFFYANGTTDWGVPITDAADYLMTYGVPDEGCYPDPFRPYDPDSLDSLPGWENRTVKITSWGWVPNDVTSMKWALVHHGPLIVCILQRNDFLYYWGGVYTPHRWMQIQSGHVVTLVGYDDSEECWILRNSAGEAWGEDGYARISYDAQSPYHPFFWPFYGVTGVFYIDGVYGNFMPDVPQVYITNPQMDHTYVFDQELPTLLQRVPSLQRRAPRIYGPITVEVDTSNTDRVEFYLDGELQFLDEESPFSYELDASRGLHTLELFAYNEHAASKDIMDFYVMI